MSNIQRILQRILVALDFSDCAWDVANHALKLAQGLGADVLLVHVDELPQGINKDTPVTNEAGETLAAGAYLHGASEGAMADYLKFFESKGVSAESDLLSGPIAESIVASANEHQAEMIVMGTHGRRGMSRLLAGSVAEKVSRLASCPVTTLRTEYKESCTAQGCDWCDSHVSKERRQLMAEAEG
ncbi:MAG: universal stress protein [Deltaproteobacteria bacterium]|nr:universal stress protein [Deltaproteobacteria bacterium]